MKADEHPVAERLRPFGTTIFAEMTRLAVAHEAINLSQGFPDFDGPDFVKQAAIEAIRAGHGQYARMQGVPALNQAIARRWGDDLGLDIDPDRQVTVTSGCTEAIAAAMLGLVNPGDEVILFEPFYDSYRACVAMAGGVAKFVALRACEGEFFLDEAELRAAFTPKTRVLLLNTPHNPTGKVFSEQEMALIATLCEEHGVVVVTDEVYEHLVYEADQPHVRMASLPGMFERTLTLSSLGKTFSLTGWKIGWAVGPEDLTRAIRGAHQFLTFASATPLQHAAAKAISSGDDYVADLVSRYRQKRDYLAAVLEALGMRVFRPAGTFFIMADFSDVFDGDDVAFCRKLTEELRVAAIPPSVFYHRPELGSKMARFAFCKNDETLAEAAFRLEGLSKWKGPSA